MLRLLLPLLLLPAVAIAQSATNAAFTPSTYRIERTVVRGNERTGEDLILAEISLRPGDRVDERRIARSRARVLGLGVFRDVQMRLERGSAPGQVVLVVEVEERPTLVVSDLFLGFTDVSPVYGGFGLADSNLLGRNLVGTGAFAVGTEGRWVLRGALYDPDFLGLGVVAALTGRWLRGVEVNCPALITQQDRGLGDCTDDELDRLRYRRTGAIATVGLRSGPSSRVFLSYRAEDIAAQVREGSDRRNGATLREPRLPFLNEGRSVLSTVAVSFEYDTRNDPFIATEGTTVRVSVEVGSKLFFSSYEYSRYSVSFSQHLPGFADHSVRLHLFGGLVQGQAPFFDQFHVADHTYFTVGANTVPRALELSFTEVSQYDSILVAGGADYQVPLFDGGEFFYRGYLYGALQVTLSSSDVDKSLLDLSFDPRNEVSRFPLSADMGLRVDTAAGVFSLGLSYPLDLLF